MPFIKKILCAVDFSDTSVHAARLAADLAATCSAGLELLFVAEPSAYELPEGVSVPEFSSRRVEQDFRRHVEQRLADLAASLSHGGTQADISLRSGLPYREIVKRAEEIGADLIVLGSHGRSGFVHRLLGSVAEKVIRIAPCPVLTVRHPAAREETS